VVHQRIGIAFLRDPIFDRVEKFAGNGMVVVEERCEQRLQTITRSRFGPWGFASNGDRLTAGDAGRAACHRRG